MGLADLPRELLTMLNRRDYVGETAAKVQTKVQFQRPYAL